MMQTLDRMSVNFTGTVQGVGFRYTATQSARDYNVTGYVMNRDDGSVELIAEGERKNLERFLDDVRSRLRGYIQNDQVSWSVSTEEFKDFKIRY